MLTGRAGQPAGGTSFWWSTAPMIAVTYSSDDLGRSDLWRLMFQAVAAAGGVPVALDFVIGEARVESMMRRVDGLLITGGGDVNPALYGGAVDDPLLRGVNSHRDDKELAALAVATELALPVLALCRGAQLVNASRGGLLHLDLERDTNGILGHAKSEAELVELRHDVFVAPDSLLASWLGRAGRVAVNSEHHQGVSRLAGGFAAVAHADDGLIEAFESRSEKIVCVQWHPEMLWPTDTAASDLLRGFVSACSDNQRAERNG